MHLPIDHPPADLWTIGHSTLPIDEFIAHLHAHRMERVVDVRRHAGSRRHPQFNPDALAASLGQGGIDYVPMPELGGRRKPNPDSRNTSWRNESFRGYADYMETPPFARAAGELARLANEKRSVVMCAESLWWRCHRSLIADAFKALGTRVRNIESQGEASEHPFTSAAHILNGELLYRDPDLLG